MPYLSLLFNALIWGLSWWPLRFLHERGLHPLWSTALFFVLGVVLLVAWRPSVLRGLRQQPALWVLALAAGATNAGFNWAMGTGEVVRVVLLFYLMPLWAVLLAWLMLGERLSWPAMGRVVLAIAGAALVLRTDGGGGLAFQGLPDVLAVAAGFGFALTNVLLRRFAAVDASVRATAMFLGAATLPMVLAAFMAQQALIDPFPALAWPWVFGTVGFGLLMVLANAAWQYGAARLPVQVSSVVMLSEVFFATASAVLLAGEMLTPNVIAGGALILAAAVWATRRDSP